MKTFNIITNLDNGAGLEREYRFLRALLESYGHRVNGVPHRSTEEIPLADVNIFDEVVVPHALNCAPQNFLMPHSEWFSEGAWGSYVPRFDKILCKTKDCHRIWTKKIDPARCVYTEFEAIDQFQPTEETKGFAFLHIPGGSRTRQTDVVIRAWEQYKIPYMLTVITRVPELRELALTSSAAVVRVYDRLPDVELRAMLNSYQFVLAPSKYEGFGHLIHEALSCGAVVLTTDAAPMNEFSGIDKDCLIKVDRKEHWNAAWANIVSPLTVADAVNRAANLSPERLQQIGRLAQIGFTKDRNHFRDTFAKLMEPFK